MSHATDADHDIQIDVKSRFIVDQSDPDNRQYVFAYTITIHNKGTLPARLLSRHWVITDADGHVQEVRGDGVVGKQPYLQPGEDFSYTSGAVLETPVGCMEGEYHLRDSSGRDFEAPIRPFSLSIPQLLH